ncbi:MAG: C40 family peptidase [Bacteroidetes bacterium]|nr:C40 family peptidase [Bacteroidota bacterium]
MPQNDEQYGMGVVAVAAIRKEPDHRSEMISQLLFGEYVIVNDNTIKGWYKITCKNDGYSGWCLSSHITNIKAADYSKTATTFTAAWVNTVEYNQQSLTIPFGCTIPALPEVVFKGKIWDAAHAQRDAGTITQTALQFLHTAYLWGGRSVFGIDCSGFTQAVFQLLHYSLLRDAHLQAAQGDVVNFIQEARCGDLAFFDNAEGHIIHVGLLLGENKIMHSAGKVRIDHIDHQGIINADTGERTQHLRIIKRYF